MSTSRLPTVVAAACLALVALAPAAHADTTGADIVGFVNAQRAANGFPAGITEDTAASAACAAWASGTAGVNSPVTAQTWDDRPFGGYFIGPWTATSGPFDRNAWALPYVLAPRLATLGAADVNNRGCATVMGPGTRPAPAADVTYSYPGDGVQDVRTSAPFRMTQPDLAPPSPTAETGPALYAFFDGPDFDPTDVVHFTTTKTTSATLTGPDGASLPLDVHDTENHRIVPYPLPPEVQLVPRDGLAPFTTYHASVTADVAPSGGAARSFTRSWSFTTGASENALDLYGYGDLDLATMQTTGTFLMQVRSRAPQVTMTVAGPGPTVTQTATVTDPAVGAQFTVPLAQAGEWRFCFQSGGPGTSYRPASVCQDMASLGIAAPKQPPPVVTPAPKPAKLVVSLGKGAKVRWSGRNVSVPVRCTGACALRVAATVRAGGKSIKLGTKKVSRKTAGTVTIKYTMSKATTARLRRVKTRRLALTVVAKGAATVRKTVAISAK